MARPKNTTGAVAIQKASANASAVLTRLASVERDFAESDARTTAKAIQLISHGGHVRGRIKMGPVEIEVADGDVAVSVSQAGGAE